MTDHAHITGQHSEATIAATIAVAEARCAAAGKKFTELRRRVFEIVAGSPTPLGAYDILGTLAQERGRTDPPTVYRALEFLLEFGLLHRVESLNAYLACVEEHEHVSQFLICRDCGTTMELNDGKVAGNLRQAAAKQGFSADRFTVEISGHCEGCSR
jgi:Fur family zinc uptake transcriptional regulator